jgi:drug/metabolite transporter (DMT)-like permease
MRPLTPRLALLLTLPPLFWAGNAVIGRLAIQSMPPLWLSAARWMIALALLAPLGWRVFAAAPQRRQVAARWRYLTLLGLTGVAAYNTLQYLALVTSTPVNVTLIAASTPVGMMLTGALWFGEPTRRAQWIGAALSLAGVAVVLARGELATLWQVRFVTGDLLMLLAVASWTVYSWLLVRPPASMQGEQRPDWTWAEFLSLQMVFGLAWALAWAVAGDAVGPARAPIVWSPALAAALLYVGIFPSLVAFRAWGLGVAEAGPAVASFVANLTPLFAALLSAALLGEWPQGYHVLAFVLIVAGIAVSTRR